jgi:hypothetical protein
MTLSQAFGEPISDGFAQPIVPPCPSGISRGFVDQCARRVDTPFSKRDRHAQPAPARRTAATLLAPAAS